MTISAKNNLLEIPAQEVGFFILKMLLCLQKSTYKAEIWHVISYVHDLITVKFRMKSIE